MEIPIPKTIPEISSSIFNIGRLITPLLVITGVSLCANNRRGWNFTPRTKDIAWERAVRNGEIDPDANPEDYEFHHEIPVAGAREKNLPQHFVRGPENCKVIPRAKHKAIHKKPIQELTDAAVSENRGILKRQPRLF